MKPKLYRQISSYYYVLNLSLDWYYNRRIDAYTCPIHHDPYAVICPTKDPSLFKLIANQELVYQSHHILLIIQTTLLITLLVVLERKNNNTCRVFILQIGTSLQWHDNEHHGVSNHRLLDGLLNRLFRRTSKKTSKLHVTGLCEGNSSVTGNSPHKGQVTRNMISFDNVIMVYIVCSNTGTKCTRVFLSTLSTIHTRKSSDVSQIHSPRFVQNTCSI